MEQRRRKGWSWLYLRGCRVYLRSYCRTMRVQAQRCLQQSISWMQESREGDRVCVCVVFFVMSCWQVSVQEAFGGAGGPSVVDSIWVCVVGAWGCRCGVAGASDDAVCTSGRVVFCAWFTALAWLAGVQPIFWRLSSRLPGGSWRSPVDEGGDACRDVGGNGDFCVVGASNVGGCGACGDWRGGDDSSLPSQNAACDGRCAQSQCGGRIRGRG